MQSPSEANSRSLESGTGTNEPYYDSVPLDGQEDGEYVYIQAGLSNTLIYFILFIHIFVIFFYIYL